MGRDWSKTLKSRECEVSLVSSDIDLHKSADKQIDAQSGGTRANSYLLPTSDMQHIRVILSSSHCRLKTL